MTVTIRHGGTKYGVIDVYKRQAVSRRALVADDIPTLAIAKVEGLQDALDGKAVESDITDAIAALEVEDSAVDGQVVSAVAETDGKSTVTRRALVANDIPCLLYTSTFDRRWICSCAVNDFK